MSYFFLILIAGIINTFIYKQLQEKHKKAFSMIALVMIIVIGAYFFGDAIGEAYYYYSHS